MTGSRGLLGAPVVGRLAACGSDVIPFDLLDGDDVRDSDALQSAASGCDAIVHLAAVVDPSAPASPVLDVNVRGTWNVLSAAESAGVARVVYASSVNALGVFLGESPPDYLPIDDDHPCRPRSPYGMSKLLSERMCEAFTARTGIPTACLRFPAIWPERTYARISEARRQDPEFEWTPYWEYGAFLDVRDAAEACLGAMRGPPGHVTALLSAPDLSTSGPGGRELAQRLMPRVPWRGGGAYDLDPHRALIDARIAREVLHFRPRHAWRDWVEA